MPILIVQGDRERVFERFYRGDPARTRQMEGVEKPPPQTSSRS